MSSTLDTGSSVIAVVVQPGRFDIEVVHAEIMCDLVQHRVVDLIDQLLARPAPSLNVPLQQHDPLGIARRAERRLAGALKVSEHVLVDPLSAVVAGGSRLKRAQHVLGFHPGAQGGRDSLERVGSDALEVVRGNVIRHATEDVTRPPPARRSCG
jgi:hypothetical protein